MDLDAPGFELVGHDLRGADLLEGRLGVTMDVASDGGQVGGLGGQQVGGDAGHGVRILSRGETSRSRSAVNTLCR